MTESEKVQWGLYRRNCAPCRLRYTFNGERDEWWKRWMGMC